VAGALAHLPRVRTLLCRVRRRLPCWPCPHSRRSGTSAQPSPSRRSVRRRRLTP